MNEPAADTALEIRRTRAGNVTHLAPSSSLTSDTAIGALRAAFEDCLNAREVQVVIDLAASALLNSAALECLLDCQDEVLRLGGWLKVSHPGAVVEEIFRITEFHDKIPVVGRSNALTPKSSGERNLKLGDLLVEQGLITSEQVEEALELQKKSGKRLGPIVVDKGWVQEIDVLRILSEQLKIPHVRLRSQLIDPDISTKLDKKVARRLRVVPLFQVRGVVYLATANPQAIPSLDEVAERLGCSVRPVLASINDLVKSIDETAPGAEYAADLISIVDEDFEIVEATLPDDYTEIDEMAAGSPVINLVNALIQRAVADGASDIHIEAFRTQSRIRYRIDGVLYEFQSPRIELHAPMVSRLKVMANLDISERRLPQDGRIQVNTQGRLVDLRFSSLPGLFGEKVVLRVLDKSQAVLDIDRLGIADANLETLKRLLKRSNGLILVTGPTGSGKTTSLYSALQFLNSIEKNIVTIEDPVEYQMDIINQNQVRNDIGLSFARILKHVLRQDPDIIMVGEIRERETAEIAVQAALTGHLVLSTLHTNDSIGAVTRMIDMGVEPYLLSSALVGVVAQRLVRTICPSCRTTYLAPPELVAQYSWQEKGKVKLAQGRGCADCYDSGYKGRLAIHEILETNNELQRLIISSPSRDELTEYLEAKNVRGLFHDGLDRVLAGLTTAEEVARAIST